jgi:hypothetical protein
VLNALGTQQMYDRDYAIKVLRAFVEGQMELGRSESDILPDMVDLQRRVSPIKCCSNHSCRSMPTRSGKCATCTAWTEMPRLHIDYSACRMLNAESEFR